MISERKWQALQARMLSLGIREADLEEHFVRSSGRGGQNVNKVNTCVYLKHAPTGTEVKCQDSRFQGDNRYFARVRLCDRVEEQRLGRESKKAREIYKIRKQKQKRSKRAKEKILEAKRRRAEKKSQRKNPEWN